MTLSHSFYRWIDDNSVLLCTIKVITICYGNFRDDFINCLPLETFESMIKLWGGGGGGPPLKREGVAFLTLGGKKKNGVFYFILIFFLLIFFNKGVGLIIFKFEGEGGGGGGGNSHIKGRGCSLYIVGLKKKRSFVSLMVFSLKRSTPEAFVARFRVLSRKKDDER